MWDNTNTTSDKKNIWKNAEGIHVDVRCSKNIKGTPSHHIVENGVLNMADI